MHDVRVVADTNTVISGLLWHGAPRRLLNAARAGKPATISPTILDDPDDDAVLACAVAAQAQAIASGDCHLLRLKEFQGIRILTVNELLPLVPYARP